jgi:hypothetical protein
MSGQDRSAAAAHETINLLHRVRALAVQQTPGQGLPIADSLRVADRLMIVVWRRRPTSSVMSVPGRAVRSPLRPVLQSGFVIFSFDHAGAARKLCLVTAVRARPGGVAIGVTSAEGRSAGVLHGRGDQFEERRSWRHAGPSSGKNGCPATSGDRGCLAARSCAGSFSHGRG